jgi:hypothetical protein
MLDKKITFNISFHWQLDQLKWHLENIFSWKKIKKAEYVLVSAHKENLKFINEWIENNYKDKKVDYLFISEDHGNHFGCAKNVIEGLKYIRDKKDYDYIANVEADNQFRDEDKFIQLISKLEENKKDMLLIDHEAMYGKGLFTRFDNTRNYFHMTTLNIYSKNFVDNLLPLEYNEKYMNFGWCGAPGTPFEPYFALSLIDKNSLKDDSEVLAFIEKHSYKLKYDQKLNPCNFAVPDDLTPDRYMKYGVLNCPNARNSTGPTEPDAWKSALKFVELHDPLKYEFT